MSLCYYIYLIRLSKIVIMTYNLESISIILHHEITILKTILYRRSVIICEQNHRVWMVTSPIFVSFSNQQIYFSFI